MTTAVQEKVCRVCGILKPLTEYYRHQLARDGRHYQCRLCDKALGKVRRDKAKLAREKRRSVKRIFSTLERSSRYKQIMREAKREFDAWERAKKRAARPSKNRVRSKAA